MCFSGAVFFFCELNRGMATICALIWLVGMMFIVSLFLKRYGYKIRYSFSCKMYNV